MTGLPRVFVTVIAPILAAAAVGDLLARFRLIEDARPLSVLVTTLGSVVFSVIASGLTALVALAATVLASMVEVAPRAYLAALTGLAILPAFQDAVERTFTAKLRFGGLVAFAVAATPFELGGVTSAFWAMVAGLMASFRVERPALLAAWRQRTEPGAERIAPAAAPRDLARLRV